jgi:hypothetical protein
MPLLLEVNEEGDRQYSCRGKVLLGRRLVTRLLPTRWMPPPLHAASRNAMGVSNDLGVHGTVHTSTIERRIHTRHCCVPSACWVETLTSTVAVRLITHFDIIHRNFISRDFNTAIGIHYCMQKKTLQYKINQYVMYCMIVRNHPEIETFSVLHPRVEVW